MIVASVRVTEETNSKGVSKPVRKITQLRKTPLDVADNGQMIQGFSLVWYFSLSDGALVVEHVYCILQFASAAGISITGDRMTDVVNAEECIYARIDATNMISGIGKIEVMKDPEGVTTSESHVLWLQLYNMTRNTVTADLRAQSLSNIQLFHA
jgi:hypothetical protein